MNAYAGIVEGGTVMGEKKKRGRPKKVIEVVEEVYAPKASDYLQEFKEKLAGVASVMNSLRKDVYILDTCVIIDDPDALKQYSPIIVPAIVLEELDNLKDRSGVVAIQARKALKILDEDPSIKIDVDLYKNDIIESFEQNKHDNLIVSCALYHGATLITNDVTPRVKARALGLLSKKHKLNKCGYTGVKKFLGGTCEINEFFDTLDQQDLTENQYVIMYNSDLDDEYEFVYKNKELVPIRLPNYIKGLNSLQRCALDLLDDDSVPIKFILGGYGSGKTFLSVQVALNKVRDTGKYAKILCVREPEGEGKDIGALPGTKDDKIGDFFKPIEHSLKAGIFELKAMEAAGQLEKDIPGHMKGCTYDNTVILCDEAEDLKYKQLRLIGTRLGKNSCIMLVGDFRQSVYDGTKNNGLIQMVEQLKGNPKVGIISLEEDVRSEASKIFADLGFGE